MNARMDFTQVEDISVGHTPPTPQAAPPANTMAEEAKVPTAERVIPLESPDVPGTDGDGEHAGGVEDLESLMRDTARPAPTQSFLARLGFGGRARQVEEERRRVLRCLTQPLPRAAVVGVANTKGGAGKTPLAIVLGGALGTERGSTAVVDLWLRGNLGDRTVSHGASVSIEDLRQALPILTDGRHVRSADIMQFLRFQPTGKFGVLAAPSTIVDDSQPEQINRSSLTAAEVGSVLDLVGSFHDVTIIDNGNNDADEAWLAAVQRMDVLVVPIKYQRDHVLQAARLLETLTDSGHADLARRAIVVATHTALERRKVHPKDVSRYQDYFQSRGHEVLELPSDPVIANNGGVIEWDELTPATQDAGRRIAALVIERAAGARPRNHV